MYVYPRGGDEKLGVSPKVFSARAGPGTDVACQMSLRVSASVTNRVSVGPSLTIVDLP